MNSKALLILAALLLVQFQSGETFGTNSLRNRVLAALNQAGYTVEALGHAGESLGEAVMHLSTVEASAWATVVKTFAILIPQLDPRESAWRQVRQRCPPSDFTCQAKLILGVN